VKGSKEVEGAPVVMGGEMSEVLDLIEEAFDGGACGDFATRDLDFSVAFGGDEMLDTKPYRSTDDTQDRVHGGQQLALWNAHYESRCFLPIHIYEATTRIWGDDWQAVAVILRSGRTPDGPEVALMQRRGWCPRLRQLFHVTLVEGGEM
jgi:hypothetical protein